ncbi:MAG: hypothetical protein ACLR17_02555 [Enterobacteriaceae bacterium]
MVCRAGSWRIATASPLASLGETMALIAAPGAQNVAVLGQSGVKTDRFGYHRRPTSAPIAKTISPEYRNPGR